jgi:predicted CopG family antitoxin
LIFKRYDVELKKHAVIVMVTASLSKTVFDRLKTLKKAGESISDVIMRLTGDKQKTSKEEIRSFEGILENGEKWDEIEKILHDLERIICLFLILMYQ